MNQETFKICRIHWRDAHYHSGWHNGQGVEELAETDYIIESVGWLVAESERNIVLAHSCAVHKISDLLIVPRELIVDRWEL